MNVDDTVLCVYAYILANSPLKKPISEMSRNLKISTYRLRLDLDFLENTDMIHRTKTLPKTYTCIGSIPQGWASKTQQTKYKLTKGKK